MEELGIKNEQLTKKLEATHSELTQKVLDAMKDAKQVCPHTLAEHILIYSLTKFAKIFG